MANGSIRKITTKSGETHYQLIVEDERDPETGERRRSYKTVKGTYKEAKATLRRLITDVEDGDAIKKAPITVQQWVEEYINLYVKPTVSITTLVGYKNKINCYIIPELGKIKLTELKAKHVQGMVNKMLEKGLSPKSIREAYNLINAPMKKAVVLRKIKMNPCDGISLPKNKKPQFQVYDTETMQRALECAKGTDMYIVLYLLFNTGLRRGELLALRWENVDLVNGVISVKENMVRGENGYVIKSPKTESGIRDIHIGDDLVAELRKEKAQYARDMLDYGVGFNTNGFVVRKKNGDPICPDSMTQKWERFVERYDLPKIRLHDTRHSNATALIEAGVSPKVVQERLGHTDISMTLNTYTHVLPQMDIEAAQKINDIIKNNVG